MPCAGDVSVPVNDGQLISPSLELTVSDTVLPDTTILETSTGCSAGGNAEVDGPSTVAAVGIPAWLGPDPGASGPPDVDIPVALRITYLLLLASAAVAASVTADEASTVPSSKGTR